MRTLPPKARRFIALAIEQSSDPIVKGVWAALDGDTSADIPESAGRAALAALREYEGRLRTQLETPALSEDEMADISNDLGTVCAIEHALISTAR